MASENVIQATFDGFYKIHTKPSWLIDHGMELSISGIDLPDEFECHFSNSRSVAAKRQIGENGVVTIPDEYFLSNAAQIFCWIYLHPTADSGVTEYEIVIPLLTRPNVDPAEPTQEQQDIVDQAIAALNVAMAETSADAESASASATAAQAAVDSVLNMTVSADTLPSGSDASVTKSVVDDAVHLAFGIPQGAQGVQGEQGVQGPTGATPNFTIGTVQTLLPTQDATATITGTAEAPVLNLGIPKGYSGDATNLAADYSSNKIYAVGEYCIYNGSLYRCITAITTAEAWTAAHWTAAALGDDVGDLKSALDNGISVGDFIPNSYVETNGRITSYSGWKRTNFISVEKIKKLKVKSSAVSNYNCFYSSNTEDSFISSFGVSTTEKEITIPDSANYVVFSNTNSGMDNLTVSVSETKVENTVSFLSGVIDEVVGFGATTVTMTKENWYISSGVIAANGSARSVYFPCEANALYKVKKIAGTRYSVGCTNMLPAVGVACTAYKTDSNASEITIFTTSDAQYLVVYYWFYTDSVTADLMYDSIQISRIINIGDLKKDIDNIRYYLSKAVYSEMVYNTKNYIVSGDVDIDGEWKMHTMIDDGYIYSPITFSPSGAWEISIKFRTTYLNTYSDILAIQKTGAYALILESEAYDDDYYIHCYFMPVGAQNRITINTPRLALGSWITLNAGYDGTDFYVDTILENGMNYIYKNSGGAIDSGFTINVCKNLNGKFIGDVDLASVYAKDGNTIVWRAVE